MINLILLNPEIGFSLGYGQTQEVYNDQGSILKSEPFKRLNMGSDLNYVFLKNWLLKANLNFSSYTADTINYGFSLQFFSLSLGYSLYSLMSEIGFHVDLGKNNSDGQNALFTKTQYYYNFLSFGFEYFYTLRNLEKNYDYGDFMFATLGINHKLKNFKLGIDLIYRYKTKGTTPFGKEDPIYYSLSLVPYLEGTFNKFRFTLKLGYIDEYNYFGISLFGKNELVGRLSLTIKTAFELK